MTDNEPLSEGQISDEALKDMLKRSEPVPPQDLGRAVRFTIQETLKFRGERNIATQADFQAPISIKIGRSTSKSRENPPRDFSGYPGRINLAVHASSGVSRQHCQLEYKAGNEGEAAGNEAEAPSLTITDEKSTNGTFVDGQRIANPLVIFDERDHTLRLGLLAAEAQVGLESYKAALESQKNAFDARLTQAVPVPEQ